jgi:hypothetical protein
MERNADEGIARNGDEGPFELIASRLPAAPGV